MTSSQNRKNVTWSTRTLMKSQKFRERLALDSNPQFAEFFEANEEILIELCNKVLELKVFSRVSRQKGPENIPDLSQSMKLEKETEKKSKMTTKPKMFYVFFLIF
jgi:hypothetical protein